MIFKGDDGTLSCGYCAKVLASNTMRDMKKHVETHVNAAHPCEICGKIFKTTNALATHYSRAHKTPLV